MSSRPSLHHTAPRMPPSKAPGRSVRGAAGHKKCAAVRCATRAQRFRRSATRHAPHAAGGSRAPHAAHFAHARGVPRRTARVRCGRLCQSCDAASPTQGPRRAQRSLHSPQCMHNERASSTSRAPFGPEPPRRRRHASARPVVPASSLLRIAATCPPFGGLPQLPVRPLTARRARRPQRGS